MEERERGGGRKIYRYQAEGAVARHKAAIVSKADWFKEKREDEEANMADDERTMNVMVDLANTINANIVMTGDCPSKHESGRVPMLDLAIFMEDQQHEVNTTIGRFKVSVEQVSYGFYKKPMASKLILRSSTALPERMKHENAANELICGSTTPTGQLRS